MEVMLQPCSLAARSFATGTPRMLLRAIWFGLRSAVVVVSIVAVLDQPQGPINADWRVGLVAGFLLSAAFSIWLPMWRRRRQAELSAPFSLTTPFLPINKYPIRAWLLMAASMVFAGAAGLVANMALGWGSDAMGGIFLGLGAPLLATLVIWGIRS